MLKIRWVETTSPPIIAEQTKISQQFKKMGLICVGTDPQDWTLWEKAPKVKRARKAKPCSKCGFIEGQ